MSNTMLSAGDEVAGHSARQRAFANRMEPFATIFDGVSPWAGEVPQEYFADFTGGLTHVSFNNMADPRFKTMAEAKGGIVQTRLPVIEDGEAWFEAVNWVSMAREAKDAFVMMTLGAYCGAQAVGSYRMLQLLNPMPCKLVAVEPAPENYKWIARHFLNNGIDPAMHWLVPHALSGDTEPVLFPVGAPRSGDRNAIATNEMPARANYVELFTRDGAEPAKEALRNLLLHNTTGITRNLGEGLDSQVEIKLMSAITLRELLSPFERVDYVGSDIQQSEIIVFPPFIDLLRKKVRRVHIGTHGRDVHWSLHDLFADNGWEILFSFEPDARHDTELGCFETSDGILTAINPDL